MSAKLPAIKTDLAKLDRSPIAAEEYEEIPELTDAEFALGVDGTGMAPSAAAAQARRRGRPQGSHKTPTTLRLDDDILAAFRARGRGWQTSMNDALREWLATHSSR